MCHVSVDMVMGTRYQTGIVRAIFCNVRVAMAWCETKSGGGYKKRVCVIAGGKVMTVSIARGVVSRTGSGFWVVFNKVIMHTGAPVFGTSSCLTGGSPGNVLRRVDGLNWPGLSLA